MKKSSGKIDTATRRQFLHDGLLGAVFGWMSSRADGATAPGSKQSLAKEFQYNVSSYQKTDPKLVKYRLTSQVPVPLKEPRCLAIDAQDQVYVAGDNRVCVLNAAGELLREIKLANPPRCLAVSKDQLLYAAIKEQVCLFDKTGRQMAAWPEPASKSVITAIALAENDVFIADAGSRLVWRYDLEGRLLNSIGKKNPAKNTSGFIVPSPCFDLAVGPDGLLWVVNPGQHRLEAYTFDGDLEVSWGTSSFGIQGFCGCCNPASFAFLPDGRFVTGEKGLLRIKLYSAAGEFEGVVAGPEVFARQMENPQTASRVVLDVAADSAGRVWVVDPLLPEIRVFTMIDKQ